jgi:hypothetical protein
MPTTNHKSNDGKTTVVVTVPDVVVSPLLSSQQATWVANQPVPGNGTRTTDGGKSSVNF